MTEDTWRRCFNCSILFYCGRSRGRCPRGEAHDPGGSERYTLYVGPDRPLPLVAGWRWCQKCEGLFYFGPPPTGSSRRGRCPAGGRHDPSLSGQYSVATAASAAVTTNDFVRSGGEVGWEWCQKCEGMFFAGGALEGGLCPRDRMPHDSRGSNHYRLMVNDLGPTVWPQSWRNWAGNMVAPRILRHCRPTRLEQLVSIVKEAAGTGSSVRAVGSSWSFSDVALPQVTCLLVETDALDRSLFYVTDRIPNPGRFLHHVEAGIKIHDLNDRLDALGLALPTLGGAGGQSLAGVISTATHGGDIDLPPIPDMVAALHLVAPDGQEYWLEPASSPISTAADIKAALPHLEPRNIRYNDDMFNAVLVSMGCMGILYSIVVKTRTPYDLLETTIRTDWTRARAALADGFIYMRTQPDGAPFVDDQGRPERVRFLQVVVPPNSPSGGAPRPCFITTRQEAQPSPNIADGTPRGVDVITVLCQLDWGPTLLALIPILDAAILAAAAVAAALAGPFGPLVLLVAGFATAAVSTYLIGLAISNPSFEQVIASVANLLDSLGLSSIMRDINTSILAGGLPTGVKQDKSYRIMDTFNYEVPDCYQVDSVEMFFDATAPSFLTTLDSLLSTIDASGNVFGYLSLRFTGPTRALLGMERAPLNCAAELSILKEVADNAAVLKAVQDLTIASGGRLHWGQRNERLTAATLPAMYPGLSTWRTVRARLAHGENTFDNALTGRLGL